MLPALPRQTPRRRGVAGIPPGPGWPAVTVKCDVCGAEYGGMSAATIVDESGGSVVHICRTCREMVTEPRCRVCGSTENPRRAEGIVFHSEEPANGEPTSYRICDDCRLDLITGRGVPHA